MSEPHVCDTKRFFQLGDPLLSRLSRIKERKFLFQLLLLLVHLLRYRAQVLV